MYMYKILTIYMLYTPTIVDNNHTVVLICFLGGLTTLFQLHIIQHYYKNMFKI